MRMRAVINFIHEHLTVCVDKYKKIPPMFQAKEDITYINGNL
jgi:hypothetical protein